MSRHLPNSIPWAAAELGVSTSTMQRLVARDEVKTVEVNGLRRVPDSEIERLQPVMGGGEHRRLQRLAEQAGQWIASAWRPKSACSRAAATAQRAAGIRDVLSNSPAALMSPGACGGMQSDMKRPGVSTPRHGLRDGPAGNWIGDPRC